MQHLNPIELLQVSIMIVTFVLCTIATTTSNTKTMLNCIATSLLLTIAFFTLNL